jgi:hypothetical protein
MEYGARWSPDARSVFNSQPVLQHNIYYLHEVIDKKQQRECQKERVGPREHDSTMRRRRADGEFAHPNASNCCFQA